MVNSFYKYVAYVVCLVGLSVFVAGEGDDHLLTPMPEVINEVKTPSKTLVTANAEVRREVDVSKVFSNHKIHGHPSKTSDIEQLDRKTAVRV